MILSVLVAPGVTTTVGRTTLIGDWPLRTSTVSETRRERVEAIRSESVMRLEVSYAEEKTLPLLCRFLLSLTTTSSTTLSSSLGLPTLKQV